MKIKDDTVVAKPSKAFFIDMITRDLGLTDCILDLIDNSIDQAVERARIDIMKTLTDGGRTLALKDAKVNLRFSGRHFIIEDTCGGIPIEDAKKRVFLFGNPFEKGATAGLSVYGIGMKRAFFKLGRLIRIQSATDTEWFVIDIDVDDWRRKEDDWSFSFTNKGRRKRSDPAHPPRTTKIEISRLRDEVVSRFSQGSFHKDLTKKIATTYSLFMRAGLDLRVNSTKVDSTLPTLGTYKNLTSARKLLTADHDRVTILIIAGVTPKDDKMPRGWYVFCNGRMVLEADRSHLTGWGEVLPQWHSKFAHFVGYVYFKSNDGRRLPWTTTKQSIVFESSVYQTALSEMQLQARPILNFLGSMYPSELAEEDVVEREVLLKAKSISIDKMTRRETPFKVDLELEKRKKENAPVSIQYKKPKKHIDRIRQHLKKPNMSASRIGEYTFDYFLKQECEQ